TTAQNLDPKHRAVFTAGGLEMSNIRPDLNIEGYVTEFRNHCATEAPQIAEFIDTLDNHGRREMGGILGRFDLNGNGKLDAQQRLFASRVLDRLHRPTTSSLELTNKILDYLDLNANAVLEEKELDLAVEILEIFAGAESDNATLSERELGMLYAVLRHIDSDDNHQLDPGERRELREALNDPKGFIETQKANNPLLSEFL